MPSSPPRKKLGVAIVNAMPPNTTVWDADLKGFCARRQRSSAITYLCKTRINGRIRWFTIGQHGQPGPEGYPWTPELARKAALRILGDPQAAETPAPDRSMSFALVAEQFLANHGTKIKPRTLTEYTSLVRKYLLPTFGAKPIQSITRADVSTAHAAWKGVPRAANHALAVLSKLMTWAEDQGYRTDLPNPCQRVQRYRENKRQQFLTPAELARLGAALDKAETEHLVGTFALAAIRLLILTGARLSEILTLQWSYIDLDRRMIFLPDSKTGQKPLTLNEAAIAVLNGLPRFANNPYVIVGHRYTTHLVNLQKPWQAVRKIADLEHVRIHDLRHTFASVAVANGGSLPILGRQLGHSQPQTTARYAHLGDDPVRHLTETTGKALEKALNSNPNITISAPAPNKN